MIFKNINSLRYHQQVSGGYVFCRNYPILALLTGPIRPLSVIDHNIERLIAVNHYAATHFFES